MLDLGAMAPLLGVACLAECGTHQPARALGQHGEAQQEEPHGQHACQHTPARLLRQDTQQRGLQGQAITSRRGRGTKGTAERSRG